MCPNCRAFITTSDKVCPYCDTPVGPRAVDRRQSAEISVGFIPHARFVTVLILTINFGLYAATALFSMQNGGASFMDIDGRTLLLFGAKYNEFIAAGQWWRLITAGFLHGGLFHILMNSWVLFDLGAQVEELYGARRLIVIYFLTTVFGFMVSTWWSPALSIGASAGIFGLLGAMIALGMRSGTVIGAAIRSLYIRWAVYGLLIGLLPFFRIDNAAHIGGLIAGFVTGFVAGTPLPRRSVQEKLWGIAALACIVMTAFAFLQMFLFFGVASRF